MTDFSPLLASVLARHAPQQDALLPILHDLQDHLGFIPPETLTEIAQHLAISRAELEGVLAYYDHFRTTPPPHLTIALCQAEACRSRGAVALRQHVEQRLGCQLGQETAEVSLQSVYCLGLCASGPALEINHQQYAAVTPARFDALIQEEQSS